MPAVAIRHRRTDFVAVALVQAWCLRMPPGPSQGHQQTPRSLEATPWDTFRKAVDSENYYSIRQVCTSSTEGCLQRYEFVEPVTEETE